MYQKALLHFQKVDPILFRAAKKTGPVELQNSSDYFIKLCKSIINQQLSNKVGDIIFERFKNLFPKQEIMPYYLLKIKDKSIRNIGISFPKIKYLKDLAQKIVNKEIILEDLQKEKEEIIIESLIKVKGIGRWTAEMFLMFCLGRKDIFSPGDLGLRNAVQKLYELKDKPSDKLLMEISQKWSPYRTYASMILWKSLEVK
ncbi:MAG: hypothetical protein A2857_04390 [Candidatus Levybacteria bacterium RIFCSPHIGHO2_01_FULL_36_15]|nr:MAG: hypothetical protein A2857_04390 [Candidatus Levybacteria bacterium RIFCSPHIGHO2_01_FULL_36_15]OGH37605.1 MAG: hypothetical protein A2905_05005 [Candidatus Levybacteria bacterium RIFCSPLOWO2_01_FULL_36_10]